MSSRVTCLLDGAVFTMMLLTMMACKKDDPCDGLPYTCADFIVEQECGEVARELTGNFRVPGFEILKRWSPVHFRIKQTRNRVKWYINDQYITDEQTFKFTGSSLPNQFTVTCIARADQPSLRCPGDDLYDTAKVVIRNIEPHNNPILGRWRGVLNYAPLDTFEFTILPDTCHEFQQLPMPFTKVDNIPDGAWCYDAFSLGPESSVCQPYFYDVAANYFFLKGYDYHNCYSAYGLKGIFHSEGDIMSAHLTQIDTALMNPQQNYYPTKNFTFYGYRVQ